MTELFTGAQAQAWTSGTPHGALPKSFSGVSTDTRQVQAGELFVALRGERYDGHAFVSQAIARGATAAMVAESATLELGLDPSFPRLSVEDTLAGLGALARGYRSTLSPRAVVGVTGSVGKTSTKELLAAALSPLGPVLKTEGNFNNEIGLPLTLFRLRPEHRAAVIEMGMNHEGEITRLAAIAKPDVGVVLNVREVHLKNLGSLANIARAKGELFRALPVDGIAIANADDPLVLEQAKGAGRRTLTFGRAPSDVQLLAVDDRGLGGVALTCAAGGRRHAVTLGMLGAHNALNACAALCAALSVEVPLDAAVSALAQARPAPHRLALVTLPRDVVLLDDCYNASPSSMVGALETLSSGAQGRRQGAILGDMLELGPTETALHEQVGRACGELAWLLCFGERARAIAEGARSVGVAKVHCVEDDFEAAARWAREQLAPGDAVLVKASRGMRLERFLSALGAAAGSGEGH